MKELKKYQKGGGVTIPRTSDRRGARPKLTEEERIKKEVEARKKRSKQFGKGAIPTSKITKRYGVKLSPQERKKREIEANKKFSKQFGKGAKMKEDIRPSRIKKYQRGGAAKVAKKMSKLMKPVKTGVAKTKAKPATTIDTGKYIKNKDIKKGMSTKPLTKKYSKVMKKVKAVPSKKYTTYGSSPIKKTIDKSKGKLNPSLSKKVKDSFMGTRVKGMKDNVFGQYPDYELGKMGDKLKTKYGKPKMVKGGSLRRSRKHL